MKNDKRNSLILAFAGEGIYCLDDQGQTTFVNPAACKMLGYEEKELIGQSMHDLIHHSYQDGSKYPLEKCHICAAWTDGVAKHIDDEVLWRKDGTCFPVDYTSTPIHINETLSGAVIIFSEITERLAGEAALKSSQLELACQTELLQTTLDSIDQGFAVWNKDEELVVWNEKCEEFWLNPPNVAVGFKRSDLLHHIASKGVFGEGVPESIVGEQLERIQKMGPNSMEEFDTLDGHTINLRRYPMPQGGYAAVYTDITERKRYEEGLRNAMREADRANKAKSDFLSAMSHELRTPMHAILGFGQMLDFNPNEPLTAAQKDCVDHIMKGGQNLLELINEVLDQAKVEAGKVDLSMENLPVRVILDDCLTLIQNMAEACGVIISIGEGFNAPLEVYADYKRFKQVLLNLMSNAVKYNRKNGKMTIDCFTTTDTMLHISVSDTGKGIAKDKQSELFQPFNRLGAERTETEGTGIGLTITQQLIKTMGGCIGFTSEEGKGSTFWIEIPLAGSDSANCPNILEDKKN